MHFFPALEYAKADYDYTALNPDELSFKVGDIIRIITKTCEDDGWWRGELNGLSGVFPDNFCSVIPLSEVSLLKRKEKRKEFFFAFLQRDNGRQPTGFSGANIWEICFYCFQVPAPKRPIRTPSSEKGGSLKKDEKENHDRISKLLPRDDSRDKNKPITEPASDDKKDKVEKTSKKDDVVAPHSDPPKSTTAKKDDDKVEKSVKRDEIADARSRLAARPASIVVAAEKKPDRPEKPVLKPVVGKKPLGGGGSRESTPPVVHDRDSAKPELKASSSLSSTPAVVDALAANKSKPELATAAASTMSTTAAAAAESSKHSDESRPRGGSGSGTAAQVSGVRLRHVESAESKSSLGSVPSSTENGTP